MSLKELLTRNYSKVSALSDVHELQFGILKAFWKACVDQLSTTIKEQIQMRGPRAKKNIMQEVKSSLDAARKAQQSSKHQTSTGTPYSNSRSQEDARWQWVKRKAKPLEDIASAAFAAFLSTNARAACSPTAAPVASDIPNPPRREPEYKCEEEAEARCGSYGRATTRSCCPDEKDSMPENGVSKQLTWIRLHGTLVHWFDCNCIFYSNFLVS